MPLTVVVVGAGIGGLCLAHGLRSAGIRVAVFEKGPKRVDPQWLQGYQIHVNPDDARVLQDCLPAPLWVKVLDNACVPRSAFQVLTEQMALIGVVEADVMNGSSHVPIVRTTLRQVLLEELDDVVKFGKEFVRYEQTPDERIIASFRDGSIATGDVLVGADGTGSNVRRQYLPNARIVDSGIVGAACRVALDAGTRRRLPDHLLTRLTIIPADHGYMIVTQSIYKPTADIATREIGDHLIWVHLARRAIYGDADPKTTPGATIKTVVLRTMDPGIRSYAALSPTPIPNTSRRSRS